jgi:hypothetical protein
MNIRKIGVLLVFIVSLNKIQAQDSVKLYGYLGKKINTVVEYQTVTNDSIGRHIRGIDSLINSTQKTQWETLLKINENKLVTANRTLKRIQVAYSNQSNYFFDSQTSANPSGVSLVINSIYNGLINKDFKEIVPASVQELNGISNFKNKPNQYNVSPYDTTKYVSDIFFFQNIPMRHDVNDTWNDTLITEKAVLLISFTIKSISQNNLALYFKSSIVALNYNHGSQSNSNNQTRISIFENSTTTEGFMNIDPDTHFIYSIRAATTRKMESNINNGDKKAVTIISKFVLNNAVE